MFPKLPPHMVHNMNEVTTYSHHLVQLILVFLPNSLNIYARQKGSDKMANRGFIFHALNHAS